MVFYFVIQSTNEYSRHCRKTGPRSGLGLTAGICVAGPEAGVPKNL